MGTNGYLLRHELFLYVFDAFLMLIVMVIYNLVHPSEVTAMLKGGKWKKGPTGHSKLTDMPLV